MDKVTRNLDNIVAKKRPKGMMTDVACCNKIKLDYLLMLTIAAAWDLKNNSMDETQKKLIIESLNRPEVGKLIGILKNFALHESIVKIFDLYKKARNLQFGHTTFDEFQAKEFNEECVKCWEALMSLPEMDDENSEIIRNLYQKENELYYVENILSDGKRMVVHQFNRDTTVEFERIQMKAWLGNTENCIDEGDLFILVDDKYIKLSPFIQFDGAVELFMMLMDIENFPALAFKMAYVHRTEYAKDSCIRLEIPKELENFFPRTEEKIGKNGVFLNKFSQYSLFKQDYYRGVHSDVQEQLNQFISGYMAYGAVRGIGGVGKTSAVFMWMNQIINDEKGILRKIRQKFDLRRIIFLSAKTKIYSRDVNEENLSNFYEIDSDVSSYEEIIEAIYSMFHPQEKEGITLEDKITYIKEYSNQQHAVLVIIDDYESLPAESREKVQRLKDELNPLCIKMLITTRFASKESKDIIVERLNERDCSMMTDYIFDSSAWRNELDVKQMHDLTGGLPLLIWYAKAYFNMGQLTKGQLERKFSGPAKGLESYLYDNFVECFEDSFAKNFLMIASRYYKDYKLLQMSKKIAVFLCLKEAKEYKQENEEFYFRELLDLKLISINQSANSVDFSPLMLYMDKTSKQQEPQELYQEDSLVVLKNLNEEKNKELYAILNSIEMILDDEGKRRVLERFVDFVQTDVEVRNIAISRLFAITENKIDYYSQNPHLFATCPLLIETMMSYLLENICVMNSKYKLIRGFLDDVSKVFCEQDGLNQIVNNGIEIMIELLQQSYNARERETISNNELEMQVRGIMGRLIFKFLDKILDDDRKKIYVKKINTILEDISVYCEVEPMRDFWQEC